MFFKNIKSAFIRYIIQFSLAQPDNYWTVFVSSMLPSPYIYEPWIFDEDYKTISVEELVLRKQAFEAQKTVSYLT